MIMNTPRLIGLLLTIMLCTPAEPVAGAVLCPLTNQPYTAELETGEIKAFTGQPVFATVRLDPPEPPAGYTVSTLVEVVRSPAGAKPGILPGFPRIRLTFPEPGTYFLKVTINLITKSSCGGVEAEELTQSMLKVVVSRP